MVMRCGDGGEEGRGDGDEGGRDEEERYEEEGEGERDRGDGMKRRRGMRMKMGRGKYPRILLVVPWDGGWFKTLYIYYVCEGKTQSDTLI